MIKHRPAPKAISDNNAYDVYYQFLFKNESVTPEIVDNINGMG